MPTDIEFSPLDLTFLADQMGQIDVLLHFLIDAIRSSNDFAQLQDKIDSELKQVKMTRVIAVDEWLKSQTKGFVALVRPKRSEDSEAVEDDTTWHEANPVDYWRDEEALPIVFAEKKDVYNGIPNTYDILNIVNLAEQTRES